MATLLGIDTGGTYTDAILYDDAARAVLRAGKALTTKQDLALGIEAALDDVLPPGESPPLGFVSLSTTLATNAVVEGQGGATCLLLIGQGPATLDKAGLRQALGDDPVVYIAGGHDATGEPQCALDIEAARAAILDHAPRVGAFAVAGYFATRNPRHELAVRDLVRELSGLPVTCSHELSSALDAPRRALTTLLNARLIPMLQELILAVQSRLAARSIKAPLMVVKGDGSVVSAETAMLRPVETVLSGPAASVVGAYHLTGLGEAFVADIGGTTMDIALILEGKPRLAPKGATVGGWRTMVEAVDMHAVGLGGDSEVHVVEDDHAEGTGIRLGPRRAVPLCLLARLHPHVTAALRRQAEAGAASTYAGCFALRSRAPGGGMAALSRGEQAILARLADGPLDLEGIEDRYLERRSLERLVARGLVVRAGFTPSDAAHLLGLQDQWDADAARLGALLWAARLARFHPRHADIDGLALSRLVVEQMVRQSAEALSQAALAAEAPSAPAGGELMRRAIRGTGGGYLEVSLRLARPLIAVGAAAAAYFPGIAERLHTDLEIPRHAPVCNAVGAVAGGVTQRAHVIVTQPTGEKYRAHLFDGVADFADLAEAMASAEAGARKEAERLARAAGAGAVAVHVEHASRTAMVDGSEIFVEAQLTAIAVGRPRSVAGG